MPIDLKNELGQRIRALRIERNLSQEQLADLCRCHRTYVGMVERGEKSISVAMLMRFALALESSASSLLEDL